MSTYNGIGTKILGDFEYFDDGSYITFEWFVVFYVPLLPIRSYRVFHSEESNTQILPFGVSKSNYIVKRIPIKWKYVWKFLRVIYATIVSCIGLLVIAINFRSNLLIMALCLIATLFVAVGGFLFLANQYDD